MRETVEVHRHVDARSLVKVGGNISREFVFVEGHCIRGEEAKGVKVSAPKVRAFNDSVDLLLWEPERNVAVTGRITPIHHRPLVEPEAAKLRWTMCDTVQIFEGPLKERSSPLWKGKRRDSRPFAGDGKVICPIELLNCRSLERYADARSPPFEVRWTKGIVVKEEIVYRIWDVTTRARDSSVRPCAYSLDVRHAPSFPFRARKRDRGTI
jgi:hypothetical protein